MAVLSNGLALATDKTAIDQRFADGLLSVSEWLEEFECTSTTATPATATVVNCDRPWRTTFSGTGAAVTLNNTVSDAAHPGTIDLYAGTGTAGQSGITRFTSGLATYQVGSGQANKFDFIFRLDVLSDGTNTFTARVGGTDAITALPNNGAFIEYSSASPSSGNFICHACAAASCNDGTGGSVVAAVADTWYHGQVVTDGTTTSCTIDGTNIGSTTSTQPTAPINASAFILNSAGTGANRRLYLDAASRRTVWSPKKAL